jgi:hypothetical protein
MIILRFVLLVQVSKIRIAVEHGKEVETKLLNYRADGSKFVNNIRIAPLFGAEDRPILFVGSQTCVGEIRKT